MRRRHLGKRWAAAMSRISHLGWESSHIWHLEVRFKSWQLPAANVGGGGKEGEDEDDGVEEVPASYSLLMLMMKLMLMMRLILTMMLLMLIMNLTCTPQRSTGRGKQSGCADRWTFRKALFRHIFFLSSTGWRGKEWRTVRQRWRGRWCEPGPRQCHHCGGSGNYNTIQMSTFNDGKHFLESNVSYSSSVLAPKYHFPVPQAP